MDEHEVPPQLTGRDSSECSDWLKCTSQMFFSLVFIDPVAVTIVTSPYSQSSDISQYVLPLCVSLQERKQLLVFNIYSKNTNIKTQIMILQKHPHKTRNPRACNPSGKTSYKHTHAQTL